MYIYIYLYISQFKFKLIFIYYNFRLIVYTSGVEFAVEQVSGGVAPAAFHGEYKGAVYLTSHRV